jgi:type IX secretion system PorP/SprF family membrane protein
MKKLIGILFLFLSIGVSAQQSEQYSQYTFNNFGYNPAFAGTVKCMDLRAGYRLQWAGMPGAPKSKFASIQMALKKKRNKTRGKHAVGLYIDQDEIHNSTKLFIKGAYTYHMRLSSKYTMGLGVFAGVQQYNVNGEGIDTRGLDSGDPVLESVDGGGFHYPDIMPGILLYSKKAYWSFSVNQLYFKNLKFGEDSKQVNQYYFGGGNKSLHGDWDVFKSFLVKWNVLGAPALDLNMAWMYRKKVSFGLGYRVGESAIANLKFNLGSVKIGYAFDFPLNKIYGNYGHEVMIGFSKCSSGGVGDGGGSKPYVCPAYN